MSVTGWLPWTFKLKKRSLGIRVDRKPTHTDQYLLFDSHHLLEHKLGVIRALHYRVDNVPTSTQANEKELKHLKEACDTLTGPLWRLPQDRGRTPTLLVVKTRRINAKPLLSHTYLEYLRNSGGSSISTRSLCFSNALRQKLVHKKDHPSKHEKNFMPFCAVENAKTSIYQWN